LGAFVFEMTFLQPLAFKEAVGERRKLAHE